MKKLFTLLLSISFAPFLATAQNVGVDVAVPVQKLDVDGGIRIGNTANGVAGSLRWNAPNIQYHDGTSWVSLVANSDDQALTLALNILSIEDGNTVDLSAYLDDTDDQTLSLAANILSIVDGNTVDLSAYLDNTDAQTLSVSGTDLTITGGNTVDLGALQGQLVDADNDTKVQVEEGADEDKIRFDLGGNERWVMTGARIENAGTGRSVFIGENAGANDDLADRDNTAVGANTLSTNVSGVENTAIGKSALNNTEANRNTAVGANALETNVTGTNNTAVGVDALTLNAVGTDNTAIGKNALKNTTGSTNTAIGTYSGNNATGSGNVFIGYSAGHNEAGSDKLYIDNSSTASPLIYGDFDDNILQVNGTLNVNGAYDLPIADGAAAGYIMTTDAAGNVSWTNPDLQGDITSIIAGDGLTTPDGSTGDVTIDINPDNSTIEVDSDILRVKPEGITTNEIATDGVDSDEIAEDAVGLSEIATGGVASAEIVDNSIDAIDINTGAVTTDEILDATILPADVNVGGTANQILAVDPTGTSVEWTDAGAVSNQLTDLDADTKIEVEASADEDFIRMTTPAGEAVTIDPAGNVGVGIVEPTRSLHVAGASGGQIMVSRADATVTVGETLGEILFDAEDNNASTVDASAVIRAVSAEPSTYGNSDKGGELQFLTKSNATDENAVATERMSIAENGDVRIGESSSSGNDLYINNRIIDWDNTSYYLDPGSTSKINEIHAVGGSVTDVPYTFDGDDNTGMFRPSNHHLGLSTNGVEKVRITDVGNVGIGTTTPAQKLHVAGNAQIDGTYPLVYVNTTSGDNAGVAMQAAGSNKAWMYYRGVEDVLAFAVNSGGTPMMVLTNSANLGIGTNTPAQKLHVAGNARFDDLSGTGYRSVSVDGQGDLTLNQPTTGSSGFWTRSGNTLSPTNVADNIDMNGENITDFHQLVSTDIAQPKLVLNSSSSGDTWTNQGAYISLGESGDLGSAALHVTYRGDGYGYIGAGTVTNAVPGATYFRFDYNANDIFTPDDLGVGPSTEDPRTALEVGATDGQSLMLTRSDGSITTGNQLGGIGFDGTDGNTPDDIREASASIIAFATESHGTGDKGGELTFWTSTNDQNDDTDGTERMSIGQDGHVRIGASSNSGNDLYINDRIIDWDNTGYYIDPAGASRMNEIVGDNGSATDPSFTFGSDQSTGMYRYSNDRIGFTANGTIGMSLTNADMTMHDNNIRDAGIIEVNSLYDGDGGSQIEVHDDFSLRDNDIWDVEKMTVNTIYDGEDNELTFVDNVRIDVPNTTRDMYMTNYANEPEFRPGTPNWGYLGHQSNYWYRGYINQIWRNNEYTLSDRRVKRNIQTLDSRGSLEQLMRLNGVSYDINVSAHPFASEPKNEIDRQANEDNLGFIAQDLQEVIPQMVVEDPKTGFYVIQDYEQLFPVIIEAMKEQQRQIEALKSGNSTTDNSKLENENAELRSIINQMNERLDALESK